MLESEFWPKSEIDAVVKDFVLGLEKIRALVAYIRVGDTRIEMEDRKPSRGETLQVTVFMDNRDIGGESPSLIAIRRLKEDLPVRRQRGLVNVFPITVPFREGGTLADAIKEFIDSDKDRQIYPLVPST